MKDDKKKKRIAEKQEIDDNQKEENAMLFQQMIAYGIYWKLPDDYWEKEGIGWK